MLLPVYFQSRQENVRKREGSCTTLLLLLVARLLAPLTNSCRYVPLRLSAVLNNQLLQSCCLLVAWHLSTF